MTLPSKEFQPGQLHFVTGLRYDMSGVAWSNFKMTMVFGLAEGHWPGTKDATSVLSMLHHVIEEIATSYITSSSKKLVLHADNCSGQNKNRYTVWYIAWLVCLGSFEEVQYCFLVAGHTKNVCDGSFGHIKREFRRSSALYPAQMHRLIETCSTGIQCITSKEVKWLTWKTILSSYFKLPTEFRIT